MNSNNIFKEIYFKEKTTDFNFHTHFKNIRMKIGNINNIFLMEFDDVGDFKFEHHDSLNKTINYEFK